MRSRNRLVSAFCVGCSLLIASQSWAATIEPGQGNLTINQGKGFQPVTGRASGNIGDSVMVAPGGTATIVYDDGCRVTVRPGAVATIASLSPCASGSNAADMGLPPAAPPAGPGYYQQPDNWGWIIGGALFGAGIGIAIYEATKKNGTTAPVISPASP